MIVSAQHIELIVKRVVEDQAGYYSVYFQRPANFVFEAGDWIDIASEGKKLAGGKTYSLSSSPTEADLRITFRSGMSGLKTALQGAQPGDGYMITQYGNDYDFQLNKNQSSVLIAGGVGIAPFRSMLKEMVDADDRNQVMLIYLNQNDDFLFHTELNGYAASLPNLSISHVVTKDINRKKRGKIVKSLIKDTNQNFYVSGPPGMVESNEHLLIERGVQVRDIRIDSFGGY